jgi:diamine N-acetyltransferase
MAETDVRSPRWRPAIKAGPRSASATAGSGGSDERDIRETMRLALKDEDGSILGDARGENRVWPDPIVNIVGEKVALGPLVREHLPFHARWHNDFHVIRTFDIPRPRSIEELAERSEQALAADDALWFTIFERATGRPVGKTDLFDVDWRHGTAVWGLLIGEADARGKGYGTETARLMLDFAFTALGLHSIRLDVDEFNLAGRRAYEKAGFREIGRRRQATWMGSRFWDLVFMECLAREFWTES